MSTWVDQVQVLKKGVVVFKTGRLGNSCLKTNQLNKMLRFKLTRKASENGRYREIKKSEKNIGK
jgi:hypothetical protein